MPSSAFSASERISRGSDMPRIYSLLAGGARLVELRALFLRGNATLLVLGAIGVAAGDLTRRLREVADLHLERTRLAALGVGARAELFQLRGQRVHLLVVGSSEHRASGGLRAREESDGQREDAKNAGHGQPLVDALRRISNLFPTY